MAKVFSRIFNIVLIIMIVLLVAFLVLKHLNAVNIYNVETGSMEDKIHTGDYVLLYKTDDYKVGDIITYQTGNYLVTHRIIEIKNGKITTKGDANNINDEAISVDQIKGKIICYGGLLNFIIKYKYIIAAFFIGLYLINNYYLNNKKKNEEKEEKDESEIKEE